MTREDQALTDETTQTNDQSMKVRVRSTPSKVKLRRRNKAYWADPAVKKAYADQRRSRYETDEDFAEAERERSRNRYRSATGKSKLAKASQLTADKLPDYLTPKELSVAMGYSVSRIPSLILKGMWPEPVVEIEVPAIRPNARGSNPKAVLRRASKPFPTRKQKVFTRDQALALARVFAQHEERFDYYRTEHDDTRNALFAAMPRRRKEPSREER